jgi:cytochrome c-type biogenesis protein CcmF
MIVEIGHYALILALALAFVQSGAGLWAAHRQDGALARMAASASLWGFAFVALAFAALSYAYLVSDFSVRNVVENSHSAKPLIFKLSGVWGNHEGSMLLWVLVLALFAALVAVTGRDLPLRLRSNVLGVQGLIALAFLLFLIVTSNPFARLDPAPFEGRDLNPVLQDIGLAIHPPLLYVGYVGFSISFAFAIAALIDGRIDAAWARFVRPWVLIAWIFLTLGIAMGSYWAYYELGWGGFWFWDPVENASLMPWLAGSALLHCAIVMEKREALKIWTLLLSILTFSLSLIGTFLVRSGVLTSVHTFATDPARGLAILVILCVAIGGGLSLFALRVGHLRQGGIFAPVSREGALVLNNVLLASATAAVFIGTLYPLALEAVTGDKISVGPPFFNATFIPLTLPLILLMPIGQMLAWKRGDLLGAMQRLWLAALLTFIAGLILFGLERDASIVTVLGMAAGLWLVFGSFAEIAERTLRGGDVGSAWRRLKGLPRSAFGSAIAHAGMGVMVIGLAASGMASERIISLKLGDSTGVGPYTMRLDALSPRQGPNFRADIATFSVFSAGVWVGQIESAKRVYTARGMPTTEAGLLTQGFGQVYVSLGDITPGGEIGIRAYWKPWVLLIWIGPLIMAVGGTLSLLDRRHRIGVAAHAKAGAKAGVMTAAE